jgi:hypothetical protein
MWDFVMDKSGAGEGFLRALRFPLSIYIPSASPQSSSLSPEAGTIGQEWPQCQYPQKPKNNKKITLNQCFRKNTFSRIFFLGFISEDESTYRCVMFYFDECFCTHKLLAGLRTGLYLLKPTAFIHFIQDYSLYINSVSRRVFLHHVSNIEQLWDLMFSPLRV